MKLSRIVVWFCVASALALFVSCKAVQSMNGSSTTSGTTSGGSGNQDSGPTMYGVYTYHNDLSRTGQNLNETILTRAVVSDPTRFGCLTCSTGGLPVDGQVYGQPLVVPNVTINGVQHKSVVYVTTAHDSVYAFDTDPATNFSQLWHTSFINGQSVTTVPIADEYPGVTAGHTDMVVEVGITSTPVIDPQRGIMYVVAKTKEVAQVGGATGGNGGNGYNYYFKLHALDIATGQDINDGNIMSPVTISTPNGVPGNSADSYGGKVYFNSLIQNQRSALALNNGRLFIAFASYGDLNNYHGWVLGYDASSLALAGVFNAAPNDRGAGIWGAGGGPAIDSLGNLFVMTGNCFDPIHGAYGESVVKMSTADGDFTNGGGGSYGVDDFFTPSNQATLDQYDWDLGSGSPLILPDQQSSTPHLLVAGGKFGTLYLINRDHMGNFNQNGDQVVQSYQVVTGRTLNPNAGFLFGTPTYFNNTVYVAPSHGNIQAIPMTNGTFDTSSIVTLGGNPWGWPGATMSVSANGTQDGILWAIQFMSSQLTAPPVLHAYDSTMLTELYNSTTAANNADVSGNNAKFPVPTVVNGQVFVTGINRVDIYGLKSTQN